MTDAHFKLAFSNPVAYAQPRRVVDGKLAFEKMLTNGGIKSMDSNVLLVIRLTKDS
jgi:hypothetical protein